MAAPRITVLGSCMADIAVRVERLPVPGETLFARSIDLFAGGKGANQAIAARRLGARQVALVGRVGADPFGERVFEALRTAGVEMRYVARDVAEGTGIAIPMVLDGGENAIISAPRANMRLSSADVAAAAGEIAASDALLLQFEAPMAVNLLAARLAKDAGACVIVNTAPVAEFPPGLLALADCLVANEIEAAALAPGADEPAAQARAMLALGPRLAVVTLGEKGAVIAVAGGETTHIPAFPVAAIDTVGAGDAFCGGLAVALGEGLTPLAAAQFASAAGALATTRAGAAPSLPDRAAVVRLLAAHLR